MRFLLLILPLNYVNLYQAQSNKKRDMKNPAMSNPEPLNTEGTLPISSIASENASSPKNTNKPIVSDSKKLCHLALIVRKNGSQSNPKNTGIKPTYTPSNAKVVIYCSFILGVSTATAISFSNVIPLLVKSITRSVFPLTQG